MTPLEESILCFRHIESSKGLLYLQGNFSNPFCRLDNPLTLLFLVSYRAYHYFYDLEVLLPKNISKDNSVSMAKCRQLNISIARTHVWMRKRAHTQVLCAQMENCAI